jgi:hypothetical protein
MLGLFKRDGRIHKTVIEVLMYDPSDFYQEDTPRFYIRIYYLDYKTFRGVWVDKKTLESIDGYLRFENA